MTVQNFLDYYINLDKQLQNWEKDINYYNPSNLSQSKVHVSLIKGHIFIDTDNKKIYKVIGNRLFKKKYGAMLLATKFLDIHFFLPFEIIYNGKNFSIISQELVELKSKNEIIKNNNTISKKHILIKDNLEYNIEQDYPLEYNKILDLINFLKVADIAVHNVGFLSNKIKCYDLEPFANISVQDLISFLKKYQCYEKILLFPEVFYLILE